MHPVEAGGSLLTNYERKQGGGSCGPCGAVLRESK